MEVLKKLCEIIFTTCFVIIDIYERNNKDSSRHNHELQINLPFKTPPVVSTIYTSSKLYLLSFIVFLLLRE